MKRARRLIARLPPGHPRSPFRERLANRLGKIYAAGKGSNVASWLQGDIQPPEIEVCSTPKSGHSEAHAGLPVLTHCRHSPKRKAAPKDRSGTLFRPPQIEAQSSSRFASPRRAPTLEPGSAVCENRYSLALQRAPPRTWAISPFSSSNGSRVAR